MLPGALERFIENHSRATFVTLGPIPDDVFIVECWWCGWHFRDYTPETHRDAWRRLEYALCYECFEFYLAGGEPRQPAAWARSHYWVAYFLRNLPSEVHALVTDYLVSPYEP